MEDIIKSQQHKRNSNGNILFEENGSADYQAEKHKNNNRFMITAVSFICVFSIMVIMLAFSMSSRTAMAAKLDDMTELYNYQTNKYRTSGEQPAESEDPQTCENCQGTNFIMPLDESGNRFFKSYIITW